LNNFLSDWTSSGGIFDYDKRKVRVIELQEQTQDPEFWNDPEKAQGIMRQLDHQKSLIERWDELDELRESIRVYQQFQQEGEDVQDELDNEVDTFIKKLDDLELQNMLSDEDDHRDAIVTFNPGAGGTESQDWGQMLFRMITRWAEKKDYDVSGWRN